MVSDLVRTRHVLRFLSAVLVVMLGAVVLTSITRPASAAVPPSPSASPSVSPTGPTLPPIPPGCLSGGGQVSVLTTCAPASPSPSTSTTPRYPSQPPTGSCAAKFRVVSAWSGGYQGEVTLTAVGGPLYDWWTQVRQGVGNELVHVWNGRAYSAGDGVTTVINAPWNGSLASGQSTSFGFIANGSPPPVNPVPGAEVVLYCGPLMRP